MFRNFLKTTFRNLWKNKTYSALNIFGLAIGIACAGLIFLWVENEFSYDHQNTKRERLFAILENQAYNGKIYTYSATPGLLAPAIKTEIPGIANAARASWDQTILFSMGDKSVFEKGIFADSNLFSILTIPFLEGRPENAFKELRTVVVSEKLAKKFFPGTPDSFDKNLLGKTIRINNKEDFVVSGVFKDFPENSSLKFEWVAPFEIFINQNQGWIKNWGSNGVRTYVELNPTASPASVNKILHGFIQKRAPEATADPFLFPMHDWRLKSQFVEGKQIGGRIEFVNMFVVIAWIILLIACINFMNLATARSEKRAREVGVRKVLGAEKRNLISQFLLEAMIMSFIAVIVGVMIILLALPSFNFLVEKQLSLGLANPFHTGALLIIALVCGMVAGSYPALYLSSFNPIFVFKGIRMKSGSASLIRKGLVVFQFTISIALIIGTMIIYQQVVHIKSRDLGYSKDGVIAMAVQGDMIKNFSAIKEDLAGTGVVENTAMSSLDLLQMGSNSDDFTWDGKDPGKKILITTDLVTPEYISTTKMHLIAGKDFSSLADSSKIIINETLANLISKASPVGKFVRQDSTKFEIIGVAKNFVYGDMYGGSDPIIFFCSSKYLSNMYIKLKSGVGYEKSVDKIEAVMKKDNPGYPFDYKFVDDQFNELFKAEMLIGRLSRIFAVLAILISCLGLFGLAAYTAERRTKEIGIRKVLGASSSRIAGLLSGDFLLLISIAAVIAFPLAWLAMHKWLQNYAYRIEIHWWIFLMAGALTIFIALITISSQAIRAALANPAKSLRTE